MRKLIALAITFFSLQVCFGQVRHIQASGEYRMGDRDTRENAKALALEDAKRNALEQAGTYLESNTEVKKIGLSNDEIRAYTAGILKVKITGDMDRFEGRTHVVRVEVEVETDEADVIRRIEALLRERTIPSNAPVRFSPASAPPTSNPVASDRPATGGQLIDADKSRTPLSAGDGKPCRIFVEEWGSLTKSKFASRAFEQYGVIAEEAIARDFTSQGKPEDFYCGAIIEGFISGGRDTARDVRRLIDGGGRVVLLVHDFA